MKYGTAVPVIVMASVLVLFSAHAGAAVQNGDFEATPDPLANWSAGTVGGGQVSTASSYGGYVSTIAHLQATTEYVWSDSSGMWEGDLAQAMLQQGAFTIYPIVTGPGETALRFDAAALLAGEDAPVPQCTVMAFGGGGGDAQIDSSTWLPHGFDLLDGLDDPLPAGTAINVLFSVTTAAPVRDGQFDGETVQQTVDLYVDNVALVPEPASLAAMCAGLFAWVASRRRRA